MTDTERTANEEARHGNRDALERMTAECDALRAKLATADVLAHEVERRMVDLGGFDNRFTLRKALEAYRAKLKGQDDG